ncbi:hypothetical protein [Paracoccus liaowanqingii]|nr:hypothetical protein [Paracoccus liaowanqingii]
MFEIREPRASVLDRVLAYMADMSVEDLGLVQLRSIELMNPELQQAA